MSAVYGSMFVILGMVGIAYGLGLRRRYELITATPTTDVRAISEPGMVEIVGEVVPAAEGGETFASPVFGRECVAAAWDVYDWSEHGKHSNWKHVAEGYVSTPFNVDDGTGRVLVDLGNNGGRAGAFSRLRGIGEFSESVSLDGVIVDFERLERYRQPVDEEPPERLQKLEATSAVPEQTESITNVIDVGKSHGDRRYEEGVVEPGDEVYVLGTATHEDGAENVRLRPETTRVQPIDGDDEAPFVLSTRSKDRLTAEAKRGTFVLVGGVGCALLGLGTVLASSVL